MGVGLSELGGAGIMGCFYMGLPRSGRRVFRVSKAQKAGGDLLTLQENTNEQQKGFYPH
jgi:hypothetical protein